MSLLLLLLACKGPTGDTLGDGGAQDTGPAPLVHPFVAVRPQDRDVILAHLDQEPWASFHAQLEADAARELRTDDADVWDHDVVGDNAITAQAAAMLAWLHDDPAQAAKAQAFFDALQTDFENNDTWDVNIGMPRPLICSTSAWDLLTATGMVTQEQLDADADKIIDLTRAFFAEYVDDDARRSQLLATTQNNHPLRTAASVGVPGLAFRARELRAQEWLDWAASETRWLLSEPGQYIQVDGAVSEGPFYYGFGMPAVVGFLVAMDNALPEGAPLTWDCRNRVDVDPWTSKGCEDGAPMAWENPLHQPWFQRSLSWSMSLRLPDGLRAPLGDAYLVQQNGGAIVAADVFADPAADPQVQADAPAWVWDWQQDPWYPSDTTRSFELTIQHLARLTPELLAAAAPPTWKSSFRDAGGNALLRSGWGDQDLWALLVAEHGSVRKNVHDHVDGLSFTAAAYGEYLLLDPGYYKPSELDNAATADADSHNVILVDGQGAPDKGLLTNWGDTDAYLEDSWDAGASGDAGLVMADASEAYEQAELRRAMLMVRDRYWLVLDRIDSQVEEPRTFTWRLGGRGGYDAGGSFVLGPQGARWQRDAAGVDAVLATTAPGLSVVEPLRGELTAPHVHQFDLERAVGDHAVMDGEVEAVAPGFVAALVPYRADAGAGQAQAPLQVEVLSLGEGVAAVQIHAIDASGAPVLDLALVREPGAPTTLVLPTGEVLDTDARALFLGDVGNGGLPRQGVGLELSFLAVDGQVPDALVGAKGGRVAWSDAPAAVPPPGQGAPRAAAP